VEGFGALEFSMGVIIEGAKLTLRLRRWRVFGIPLPMWLCPQSEAFETVEDGVFRFNVEISHWLTGLIVRYRGWLTPMVATRTPTSIATSYACRNGGPASSAPIAP
jgi:Domain of unknown function (DUF4166)